MSNNKKYCLIYQPCGLGDILFIQKICNHWYNKGYTVILPVVYELAWLTNYIDNVEFISWGDSVKKLTHRDKLPDSVTFPLKDKYDPYKPSEVTDEFVYLNFFVPPRGRVMEYKYTIANLDYRDWAKYLKFNRNIEKENQLYYDILKLNDGDDYVFINRNYQTRPNVIKYNRISTNPNHYNNKKIVEMSIIDGYTLFDWLKVVENASEIHMIESALNYVLETDNVKLKAGTKNLYSRINSFHEVQYLFNLDWNYIT